MLGMTKVLIASVSFDGSFYFWPTFHFEDHPLFAGSSQLQKKYCKLEIINGSGEKHLKI